MASKVEKELCPQCGSEMIFKDGFYYCRNEQCPEKDLFLSEIVKQIIEYRGNKRITITIDIED